MEASKLLCGIKKMPAVFFRAIKIFNTYFYDTRLNEDFILIKQQFLLFALKSRRAIASSAAAAAADCLLTYILFSIDINWSQS